MDDAKERAKLSVQSAKSFQKYESHRKLLERCGGSLPDGIGRVMLRNSFSDFPSTNYANFSFDQTKERKNAFGFITKIYFIFVDLCIEFLDLLLLS